MQQSSKSTKLSAFFCLYIAQSIPKSFFSTVIPVLMRQEDFSLTTIGLLQLIKLPWILKFLWSPYVDSKTSSLGSYKRWITYSEICYAVLIFTVALLDLKTDITLIAILIVASFAASATQDIATDALAVRSFSRKDKSLVNSMQSMGSFAGVLIGSGVLLLLFKQMGWNLILPALAIFVLLALLPLYRLKKGDLIESRKARPKARKKDLLLFFTQKRIWRQIGYLMLCYSGLTGTLSMLRPYMVDLGYGVEDIGFILGIVGTAFGFVFSFLGGFVVRRIGRYYSRVLFALLSVVATLYFSVIGYSGEPSLLALYIGIALLWGAYGMSTIVVYTTAMDYVRSGLEGTDFTLQTVLTHLSGMIIATLSGAIANWLGYSGLFIFEAFFAVITLLYAIFVFRIKRKQCKAN